MFSGRIDNGDAAVAHAQWGDDCAEHLLGEFALAHWDSRKRRLLLGRDRLGMRAVYYHQSESLFAFGTELRDLLALPFMPRDLRDESLVDFLRRDGSSPAGTTFYQSIRLLPSAHRLILDGAKAAVHQYWKPPGLPPACSPCDRDFAYELRELVTAAVETRLRDGKTIAVHLSGGLDSSSVACIAARYLKRKGRRLLAICSVLPGGYDGPESDERLFVNAVLEQENNIDPVWIEPPLDRHPFAAASRWFETLGQPVSSTVSHIEELLGEAGRAHGVDVVLSGFGGDLFVSCSGSNSALELLRRGEWRPAVSLLRVLRGVQGTSWPRLLAREIARPLLNTVRYHLDIGRKPDRDCVQPGLASRVDARRGLRGRGWSAEMACAGPHRVMQSVAQPGRVERVLVQLTRVFDQEFDQALRFPLLDSRIVDFMLELPADQLQRDGWQRSVMRRAMRGILPELIRTRRDKGGAFDPALMSRIVARRQALTDWACDRDRQAGWRVVDRDRFLEVLSSVERAPRCRWRPEVFEVVVLGGLMARFLEWHARLPQRHPS
ncbi:MAG: hypothetical protein HY816_03645 [Candidatus Wallbacteria bacterium]|nr:hypothetical protein [Candidatus Wallbacteria bacterium]